MMRATLPLCAGVCSYVPASWKPFSGRGAVSGTQNFRSMESAVAAQERKDNGFFSLPTLDFDTSEGIPPLSSKIQFDAQYSFFHKEAVDTLNQHTIGSDLEGHNLDVVIRQTMFDATRAVIHTAACEHFNYCFWYKSLRPWGTSVSENLRNRVQLALGGNAVEEIKRRMTICAQSEVERCGWVYLVWTGWKMDVLHFQHGLSPLSHDLIPLLCLNIHECAFSFDYPTEAGFDQYINNFFKSCNWLLVEQTLANAANQ